MKTKILGNSEQWHTFSGYKANQDQSTALIVNSQG